MSAESLRQLLDTAITRLESVVADPKQDRDQSIFADDIILRLKLWAVDIKADESLARLERAEEYMSERIRKLLERLVEQSSRLTDVLSQKTELPDNVANQVTEPAAGHEQGHEEPPSPCRLQQVIRGIVDDLVNFSTPIKAISAVPKTAQMEAKGLKGLSLGLEETRLPPPTKGAYFLLKEPLFAPLSERLLGAIIRNPHDPLHAKWLSTDVHMASGGSSAIITSNVENFSIHTQKSILASIKATNDSKPTILSVGGSVPAGLGPPIVGLSASIESAAARSFGPTRVSKHAIGDFNEYVKTLLERSDVKKFLRSRENAFIVTETVVSHPEETVFAISVKRIHSNWWGKKLNVSTSILEPGSFRFKQTQGDLQLL